MRRFGEFSSPFSLLAASLRFRSLRLLRSRPLRRLPLLTVGGVAAVVGWVSVNAVQAETEMPELHIPTRPDLPTYTYADVAQHNSKQSGIWVTYQHGVYDISEWVDIHPGGTSKIMLAAGKAIDPFWAIYANHKTEHVYTILERYRIGNYIPPADVAADLNDPYHSDPLRHPALVVQNAKPFNAETPREFLTYFFTPFWLTVREFITPNELFYVRNHLPVPEVDPSTYVLTLSAEGLPSKTLTLDEIKHNFPQFTVTATIQCAV